MAEIQVIQHHEDADQPQVIIIMVRWNLALVTVFFKGLSLIKRYVICCFCHAYSLGFRSLISEMNNYLLNFKRNVYKNISHRFQIVYKQNYST